METNSSPDTGGLTRAQVEKLQELGTPVVASAIELCNVRLPNTGFSDSSVHCLFRDLPPVAGYAATIRIRTATPPMEGGRFSYARTDWWDHVLKTPAPRIVFIEDTDSKPGLGAFVGEVHAHILKSLGCVGVVTNGAVRDLRELQTSGLQVFAHNVTVSHAYAHVFDFGGPVDVAGLSVRPGELIHGDANGFQSIPPGILDQVLALADDIIRTRKLLTGLCTGPGFSVDKLRDAVKVELSSKAKPR